MTNATGTRMALLISDPFATANTTGSSRSARMPVTCCAFSARSSPNTPAVFFVAELGQHRDVVEHGRDVVEQHEQDWTP